MEKTKQSSKIWTGGIFAALIAAAAAFILMMQTERKMLENYEKREVYTAAKVIPRGTHITEKNRDEYLTVREVDESVVPESALCPGSGGGERIAKITLSEGCFLMEEFFDDTDLIEEKMECPVIASFRAEDIFQVAGGVLRAGDRIHIYMVGENKTAVLCWENVVVDEVFDNAGKVIRTDDGNAVAARVNIYLEKEEAELFYTRLAQGNLRVVKACR